MEETLRELTVEYDLHSISIRATKHRAMITVTLQWLDDNLFRTSQGSGKTLAEALGIAVHDMGIDRK